MNRTLTVGYTNYVTHYQSCYKPSNYRPVPQIRLQGNWLKAAGFSTGDTVEVVVEDGRVVIVKK